MKKVIRIISIIIIFIFLMIYSAIGSNKEDIKVVKPVNDDKIFETITKDIEEIKSIKKKNYQYSYKEYRVHYENSIKEMERIRSIEIISVGDIMAHTVQLDAAYNSETDEYNFSGQFNDIKEKISSKDFAIGNLETVFAGKERRYSGKNMIFNAPESLGESLRQAGFDILTTANNHSLDRGYKGLARTIDILDTLGILHTGTYTTKEESEKTLIVEKNGISFALLSYSYSTNGWPIPSEYPYSINMLDENKILDDIMKAKSEGVDIIIVANHWGLEYQNNPNIHQITLADSMFFAGADIVLGTHPHVLQPFEHKKIVDISGKEKDKFIIYSMGNFISGQRTKPRDIGMYINFKISRKGSLPAYIEEVTVMPTWVQSKYLNGNRYMRVLDVRDSISKYENNEIDNITLSEYNNLKFIESESLKHLFLNIENKEYELNSNNEYIIYKEKAE